MKRTFLKVFLTAVAAVVAILAPSVSAGAILERVSPTPVTFVQGTDFALMSFSGIGDVTGQVQEVSDNLFPPPGGSTAGCEASDFAGFVAGRLALIQRGTCTFHVKAQNAQDAGAIGVIIFNEGNTPARTGLLNGTLETPGINIPVVGTTFDLGEDTHNLLASGPVTMHLFVGSTVGSVDPARIWIGLKNSDAVGLRVDLRAEVLLNDVVIGGGELENESTGSSGFNNAQLKAIPMTFFSELSGGDTLAIRVSARRTCSGGGHNSGAVRLWYNGQPVDSGSTRDAGSRFETNLGTFFLRSAFALSTTAGSSRLSADAAVNSQAACPDRPYTAIGTWSTAF